MTRVLHSADWHLRDSALARRERGEDFRRAARAVVNTAIAQKVNAILQAGDLLNDTRPSPANIRFLFDLNQLLEQARIPMFVAGGDHDKTDPHWATMIKDVDDRDFTRGGIFVIDNEKITIPGSNITVYGQGFIGKSKDGFLAIKDVMPEADILLWHVPVKEFCGFPIETAVSMEELPQCYKLIALGDLHICDYRTMSNGTVVGYPGSTEICKNDEPLQKSVTIIEFDDAGNMVQPFSFVPIPTRKALCYRIVTEEQAQQVIQDLTHYAAENPMVFVRYNPLLEGIVGRLHAVVDPNKAIVRAEPLYDDLELAHTSMDLDDIKQPVDFLPMFFTPGTGLYDAAQLLLNPESKANDILDDYITKRLELIGQETSI